MGPTKRPDAKDKDIEKFEDMRLFKTLTKETDEYAACNPSEFGGDPWPEQEKQCWCEPKPIYQPWFCGDEGDDCMCEGWVIFGAKKPKYREVVKGSFAISASNK